MCDAGWELRDVGVAGVAAAAAAGAWAGVVDAPSAAGLVVAWGALVRGAASDLEYYGVRPALTVAALLCLRGRAGWLHGAAVLAATAALPRCDGGWWAVAAELTVLPLAYSLTRKRAYRAWCAVEALLVAGLVLSSNNKVPDKASHLTWWNLIAVASYDAAVVAGRGPTLAPAVGVLCGVVVIGVLFMSAARCDMLLDARDDAGLLLYVAGNFAMHYYPALRLMLAPWPDRPGPALTKVVAVVAAYSMLYDVAGVYGCSHPPAALVPPLMTTVTAVVALVAVVGRSIAAAYRDC